MKHCILGALALGAIVWALSAPPAGAAAPNYHVVRTVALGGDGGWDYIVDDPIASRLYITRGSYVMVVDTATGKVVGRIDGLSGCHGVAIDHKDDRGFISNGQANTVTIFRLHDLKHVADVPVGQGPDCIIYDVATNRVFAFNGRDDTASAIDASTGKVVGLISLPGRPEYAVSDGNGHIYNNITDKSEVAAIDASALSVTHIWPLAPGEHPSGIAMDDQNGRIFSTCHNQKLVVLDASTGNVVASPTIGNGPDACRFDPQLDLVFVPDGGDGAITIYQEKDPNTYEFFQTVNTRDGARTMALDPRTHHVFVVTAKFQPPAPGQENQPGFRRRSIVPGSFVLIELAP